MPSSRFFCPESGSFGAVASKTAKRAAPTVPAIAQTNKPVATTRLQAVAARAVRRIHAGVEDARRSDIGNDGHGSDPAGSLFAPIADVKLKVFDAKTLTPIEKPFEIRAVETPLQGAGATSVSLGKLTSL